MSQNYNTTTVTWLEFESDVQYLVTKLRPVQSQISNIYGIPRGGVILATMLSHQLDIPLITDKSKITNNTLIVDEIVDSGKTLEKLLKSIKEKKNIRVASVWFYLNSKIVPDYYVNIKPESSWIVFPWETIKSSKQ